MRVVGNGRIAFASRGGLGIKGEEASAEYLLAVGEGKEATYNNNIKGPLYYITF